MDNLNIAICSFRGINKQLPVCLFLITNTFHADVSQTESLAKLALFSFSVGNEKEKSAVKQRRPATYIKSTL